MRDWPGTPHVICALPYILLVFTDWLYNGRRHSINCNTAKTSDMGMTTRELPPEAADTLLGLGTREE